MHKLLILAVAAFVCSGAFGESIFKFGNKQAKPAAKQQTVAKTGSQATTTVAKPVAKDENKKAGAAKPVAAKAEAKKPATDKTVSHQCKGRTLDGERCKRAAVEGKEYCAQHADQATKSPCKSLTEEGKQCTRHALPHGIFCAQHEKFKKLADPKKDIGQCRALTENGKQCTRKAGPGWRYCEQHRK